MVPDNYEPLEGGEGQRSEIADHLFVCILVNVWPNSMICVVVLPVSNHKIQSKIDCVMVVFCCK